MSQAIPDTKETWTVEWTNKKFKHPYTRYFDNQDSAETHALTMTCYDDVTKVTVKKLNYNRDW